MMIKKAISYIYNLESLYNIKYILKNLTYFLKKWEIIL
jgi:hypothetical protein